MQENDKLEWYALEYEIRDRSEDWFWALGVIVVASALAAIIYENYLFAAIILLSGGLIWHFAKKDPEIFHFELGEKGIKAHNRIFPYDNIKSFHIHLEGKPMLLIKSARVFLPIIAIPINPELKEEIRAVLVSKKVTEEEMHEHPAEKILEYIGF